MYNFINLLLQNKMSLYWTMFGHPSEQDIDEIESWFDWPISVYDFPRFRDVNVNSENPIIKVTTRSGGGNREEYEENNEYVSLLEGFICDKDASWDSTYAIFKYKIPDRSLDKWREYIERKKLELKKSQQISTKKINEDDENNKDNIDNNSASTIVDEFMKAFTKIHENIETEKILQNTDKSFSNTREIEFKQPSQEQSQQQLSNECVVKITELLDKAKISINDLNKTIEKLNETVNKYHG
ncbi:hypothetical protein MIMI_L792 [Acanthamoeba polyphaga mimivirus]|nr:hypothetical protein MIMI_L792 [Acanthamoeba polyphaga mimivirus]